MNPRTEYEANLALAATSPAALEALAAERARIMAVLAPRSATYMHGAAAMRRPMRTSAVRMFSIAAASLVSSAFAGFALPGAIVHIVSSLIA